MDTKDITMLLDNIKEAWDRDHPQSAIAKFNEACELFIEDGDYKGLLVFFKHCLPMADMLEESMVSIIEQEEDNIYDSGKEPLRALYQMVRALAAQKKYSWEEYREAKKKAMSHPEDLDIPLKEYEWLISDDELSVIYGKKNQPIFGHNLLSYIVQQTEQFDLLAKYCDQNNNRDAACYAECLDLIENHDCDEENVLNLIEKYKSTPITIFALEDMINRYRRGFYYRPIEERNSFLSTIVNHLQSCMEHFPYWPHIGKAAELLEKLTEPEVKIHMDKTVILPNKPCPVSLERKNVGHVIMSIYRTTIEARKGYHEVRSKVIDKSFDNTPVVQKEYDFEINNKYHWPSSNIEIPPLPPGLYKMVIRADGKICFVELIQVSQLCLLVEPLPKNKKRIAVLDASTGLPIPFAGIHLRIEEKVAKTKTLKCDEKGEAIWDSSNMDVTLYPFLPNDQWSETVRMLDWYGYEYEKRKPRNTGEILTDRAIYRPGQTIHITVVRYRVNESNQVKTIQDEKLGITLTKGWRSDILWKNKLKTDDFGIAQTEFFIPEDFEPGSYTLRAGDRPCTRIEIEEYKRPTFKVKLEPYTQPYKMGDTIVIRGKATSFAGVPIANAKVNYETFANTSMWFYRCSTYWNLERYTRISLEEYKSRGESITDQEGNFKIEVSLLAEAVDNPKLKDIPLFLDIVTNVDVIDLTGETQSDSVSLPLSNRDWVVFAEMPDKMEKAGGFAFTPVVKNPVGCIHKCQLLYRVDNGEWHAANSGQKLVVQDVPIGKHKLQLEYCDEKFESEFVIFDSNSSVVPYETDCWEYQSSEVFSENGSPVIIQVGNSLPHTYILYDIFSGNNLIESGAIKTESGMARRELPYIREYGNGILINFAWVRNQEVQSCSMTIKKPIPKMELNHEWISWQKDYTPGGHVKWIARINETNGKLVPTNTIAVVYDKALDELGPHSWNQFGPRLDWNIPRTEWKQYELSSLTRHWSVGDSPYDDDIAYECSSPCCISSGSPKRGFYCRMDFGGGSDFLPGEEPIRSNFTEMAYYASNIRANEDGEIEMEFDLPDTLTTWKLMFVSFTQDMHWCYVEEEFISQKDLMLTANMPRFLRMGDNSVISTKITNQTNAVISANVIMELLHTNSQEVVFSESKKVEIGAGATIGTSFQFVPAEDIEQYVCRIFADGGTCSDGEERTIPVLSHKAKVTVTHVFDQSGKGLYEIQPQSLFPSGTTGHQLSLDYTNNTLWLAVKAMRGMVKYDKVNAISLMTALYSAMLTMHIKEQAAKEPTDIKSSAEIEHLIGLLGKLQHSDGGFSWYKGMPSSEYITAEMLMHLSRLSSIIALPKKLNEMMEKGFLFVDKSMKKIIKKLIESEKAGETVSMPSFTMLQHLYNCAISGRIVGKKNQKDFNYLVRLMLQDVHRQTIYEKAMSAVVLEYVGKREQALDYVESLCQYTETYDNRGRSFKTSRATYSWYSYKIPTHVAAMEAINYVCPDKQQVLVEMQKWLLNEKRTQTWETPIDSVNAVHALLLGNVDILHEDMLTSITVDDRMLEFDAEGKEGHMQAELNPNTQLITFKKESKGLAWGSVYANFLQPLSDVAANGSGMTIKREIIAKKEESHVGDRITVKLTCTCDRNYDMVEIVDSKAACMEPVNQLSWFDSFKNVAPHDTKIIYSYYGMAEGTYSMETEFWLDRPGTYEIGLATIQCAYAPEFRATCPSQKLVVLP